MAAAPLSMIDCQTFENPPTSANCIRMEGFPDMYLIPPPTRSPSALTFPRLAPFFLAQATWEGGAAHPNRITCAGLTCKFDLTKRKLGAAKNAGVPMPKHKQQQRARFTS